MHAWINMTRPGFSCRQELPDDGDQWIPWATMVEQVRAKGEAEGRAALLARDVVELRGQVVDLRVQVADLGAIAERLVPLDFLLHYDPERTTLERMASVIQEQRKTLGRMEGAQIVAEQEGIATRKQLREARKEIADLKRGGVVVSEIPPLSNASQVADDAEDRAFVRGYALAKMRGDELLRDLASRLRTIPADRVLGEGKVPCNPREWNAMQAVISAAGHLLACDPAEATAAAIMECRRDLFSALHFLDALRAQPAQEPTPEGGAK